MRVKVGRIVAAHAEDPPALGLLSPERARRQHRLGGQGRPGCDAGSEKVATRYPRSGHGASDSRRGVGSPKRIAPPTKPALSRSRRVIETLPPSPGATGRRVSAGTAQVPVSWATLAPAWRDGQEDAGHVAAACSGRGRDS